MAVALLIFGCFTSELAERFREEVAERESVEYKLKRG